MNKNTEKYHVRRAEWIIKLGGECKECLGKDNLEFDHTERESKEFSISKILSSGKPERVAKEMKKCQLLCKECHLEKTTKEFSVGHGGGLSGKRNCPCTLCKAKKAEYMKEYMKTRSTTRKKTRECISKCGTFIDLRGKTGMCRKCNAAAVAKAKLK